MVNENDALFKDIEEKWGKDGARIIASHYMVAGELAFRKRKAEELRSAGAPDWVVHSIEHLP
jgi:hypothetical protein